MELGSRLRRSREETGLSAEQAAKTLGLTRGQLYRYERGEVDPPLDKLVKLAALYGVTEQALIHGSDDG